MTRITELNTGLSVRKLQQAFRELESPDLVALAGRHEGNSPAGSVSGARSR